MNPESPSTLSQDAKQVTLLELVTAAADVCSDEGEVVSTVKDLLQQGSVQLRGSFRDEPIENF